MSTERRLGAVYNRVQNAVGHGQLTLKPDETGVVQKVQVQGFATENITIPSVQHYGLATSMPLGTDITFISAEGARSKALAIGSNHQSYRPKNMAVGETMLHDNTGQLVYIQGGKAIKLQANSEVDIYIGNKLVFSLTDSLATFNVDVQLNGKLNSTGDITAGTVSVEAHVHSDVQSGSSNTAKPVQ